MAERTELFTGNPQPGDPATAVTVGQHEQARELERLRKALHEMATRSLELHRSSVRDIQAMRNEIDRINRLLKALSSARR